MEITISNIPEEKFQKIAEEVAKVLFKNKIRDIETICVEDGHTEKFIGVEYEIQ